MKKQANITQDPTELRRSAEQQLAAKPEIIPGTPIDEKKLLHELQVHQIELEMLNQNLRDTLAELEILQARYFDLYDLAPVGYLTVSEQGLIQEANLTACNLLGLPRSSLIKQSLSSFILPDDQDNYYLYRKQLIATGEPQVAELRLVKQDGVKIWVRLEANLAKEPEGITVLRVVMSDITKSKQAEQALLEAKYLAEECTRIKSEFLANMSHEIRTPMSIIVNFSELVLNLTVSPEVRLYLQKIRTAMNNLLAILNDILDFSKIESGCMRIENAPFRLDDMLDNLRGLFSLQAREKQIALTIEANANVPRKLIGDMRSIQQILTNLLSNAIKFTEQGEVALTVRLAKTEGAYVVLEYSVVDTGIGLSENDLAKLFLPFSQADGSITRRFGGTGLGLAISYQLLQLMQSAFQVDSSPGKGSRFSFKLALGLPDSNTTLPTQYNHPIGAGELTLKLTNAAKALAGIRVLVAEDNESNQIGIKNFLALSGFNVEIANNGKEALALLEKCHFDAVLLDIHMPEMGGDEVCRHIREQQRFAHLPIIAITAGVTHAEREKCFASGVNDFITKPFSPERLVTTLAKWVKPHD